MTLQLVILSDGNSGRFPAAKRASQHLRQLALVATLLAPGAVAACHLRPEVK